MFGLVGTGTDSGVWATSANSAGSGVYGQNTTSGNGVFGRSTNGYGVRGDGTFVVGFGSDAGVWATSSTAAGSGVYGQNTSSGRGVYGKSTSGAGVWGQSTSGRGVSGESASQVGVYGHSNTFAGVYGDSQSTNSAGVSGNGGRYGLWGQGQTGVYGSTTNNGYAYEANGNAKQSLTGGGWVKAMAYIDPSKPSGQQVVRCFNSQVALGTANCGITVTSCCVGIWGLNFGFSTAGRFVVVTPKYSLDTVSATADLGGTEVSVYLRYLKDDSFTNNPFWVVVL